MSSDSSHSSSDNDLDDEVRLQQERQAQRDRKLAEQRERRMRLAAGREAAAGHDMASRAQQGDATTTASPAAAALHLAQLHLGGAPSAADDAPPAGPSCVLLPFTIGPLQVIPLGPAPGALLRPPQLVRQELILTAVPKASSPLTYITFRNYYVSHITVRQLQTRTLPATTAIASARRMSGAAAAQPPQQAQVWVTVLHRFPIMARPHEEGEAQLYVTLPVTQFNSKFDAHHVQRLRFDLYQVSPNWHRYEIHNLQLWAVRSAADAGAPSTARKRGTPRGMPTPRATVSDAQLVDACLRAYAPPTVSRVATTHALRACVDEVLAAMACYSS